MKDFSKTVKGAILVVIGGKEKKSLQCNLHSLTAHFTSQFCSGRGRVVRDV